MKLRHPLEAFDSRTMFLLLYSRCTSPDFILITISNFCRWAALRFANHLFFLSNFRGKYYVSLMDVRFSQKFSS